MTVPDFRTVTVEELARRVRSRELTAAAVTDAALARIDAVNPVLNAFVAVDADDARAQAAAIDRRLDTGEAVGPLAGIPLGVKDLEEAAGFVTTKGAAHHADDPPADHDSTEVARLRAAGCVVVGKTNTPEYGFIGDTHNPTFGPTRNPWNPQRSPGGSSGGTGAAVAAGMVPLGTGSDGGGSIRIPSALCGMSGFKPSLGRVPSGPSPFGDLELSTRGPMARRLRDVASALDVVVGPHPGDLRSHDAPSGPWRPALTDPARPTRLAWTPSLDGGEVDDQIAAVTAAAVATIGEAGVEVVEIDPPFTTDVISPFSVLFCGSLIATYRPLRDTPAWDAVTPLLAGYLDYTMAEVDAARMHTARVEAHALSVQLAEAMEGFDALVCPTVAGQTAVCEHEGTINGEPTTGWVRFTYPFNITRRPAASVCAGFTDDGMPVGLQVVGQHLDDAGVLEAATWVEDHLGIDAVAPDPD